MYHSEWFINLIDNETQDVDAFQTWSIKTAAKYVYEQEKQNSISYEWHIFR